MMRLVCALAAATALLESIAAMMTPWGEKVASENCWREYPRPQMVRGGWTCLNGDWDYTVTSITNTPGRPSSWEGKIRVPFAIESALSGVGRLLEPDEFLWYTRKIDVRREPGRRTLLHFDGVDFRAMVFIGHDEVSPEPHEGGQIPFTYDITDFVKDGQNELTVCVWDPTGDRKASGDFYNSRGKQDVKPHGCFYTRVSGIWQTVWMETVPDRHIVRYDVTPDIDKGSATFTFTVGGPSRRDGERGRIAVVEGGKTIAEGEFRPGEPCTVSMPSGFGLWSPESPKLYDFTAKIGDDEVRGYFAMRKFSKGKDAAGRLRFFLNNKPYYVMGTLDQGWWPDGLLTPPSEEAMAFDIQTLKSCGFNAMRKHIKVEPLRYYALCDRMGLLVLQDMPCANGNWDGHLRPEVTAAYGFYRHELRQMIDHLRAVPSIVMWIPYNEGWGQPGEFLTHSTLDFVRRYDRTRLVNGPSGCNDWEGGEVLMKGWKDRRLTAHKPAGECEAADAVDYHLYRGPGMFRPNDRRVSFLGEFGGLGHPVEGHLWKIPKEGKGNWGYGGIDDTKTREGLEKAYLSLMDRLAVFAKDGLGGSIYTQTTDVEIEINGLLTYDRKVLKFNPDVLRAAHEKIIASVASGETAKAQLDGSNLLYLSHVHRGGGKFERPDNTLETFKWCWENGSALECDCRRTKDGVGIMLHDKKLKRTARGISAELADKDVSKEVSWVEIKDVDVGSYLKELNPAATDDFSGNRIPTIEATFAAMKGHPTYLCMVDEKGAGPEYIAKKAIEAGVQDQVYYTGPSHDKIFEWNKILPGGKSLLWIGAWPKNHDVKERAKADRYFRAEMDKLRARDFKYISCVSIHTYYDPSDPVDPFVPSSHVLKEVVNEFHVHGIPVCSIPFQGGEKEETYFKLYELGFDGFSTDYPSVMFSVIGKLKKGKAK
ncbi:MAG: hypothetical protein K6G91_02515 [Kiritimatiellae bacterium]|nr:hypothetical protein [Kiritimatiellia bacterium]